MYELLYIIPSPYTEKEVPDIQKNIDKIIEETGAKIIHQENLGSRKLAYPIKHVRRGFYILINFESEPGNIKKIEEKLKLMPEVLRFQIIKTIISKRMLKIKPTKPGAAPAAEEKVDLKTLGEKIDKLLEI